MHTLTYSLDRKTPDVATLWLGMEEIGLSALLPPPPVLAPMVLTDAAPINEYVQPSPYGPDVDSGAALDDEADTDANDLVASPCGTAKMDAEELGLKMLLVFDSANLVPPRTKSGRSDSCVSA